MSCHTVACTDIGHTCSIHIYVILLLMGQFSALEIFTEITINFQDILHDSLSCVILKNAV